MADIPQPRGLGPETGIRPFAVSSIGGSLPKAAEAEVPMTTEPSVQSAQATTLSAAPASEQEAIRAVLNSYYDAFGRDATAVSAFYSEQALVVFANSFGWALAPTPRLSLTR
jgi:hypothetical protein